MKILIIAERPPTPVGGRIRLYGLIRELAARHEFWVASFAYPVDLGEIDKLKPYVQGLEIVSLPQPVMPQRSHLFWRINGWTHALFHSKPRRGQFPSTSLLHGRINRLAKAHEFDIVLIHQAYMAPLRPSVKAGMVLDMADILSQYEYQALQRAVKKTDRFGAWLEWKKMLALERQAVSGFDVCVTVSDDDRSRLLQIVPDKPVAMVPNGVDLAYFAPQDEEEDQNTLVFVGSMDYAANADAVLYFASQILPLIKRQRPNARFLVVGYGPPAQVTALQDDLTAVVTGYVKDVRPFLSKAAVVVVPLRFGSGVRNKILEAWAMGKAIVSTSLGAEGLAVRPGGNLLLADSPEQFASATIALMEEKGLRSRLGQAGRITVEEQYAWSAIARQMESVFERVAGHGQTTMGAVTHSLAAEAVLERDCK